MNPGMMPQMHSRHTMTEVSYTTRWIPEFIRDNATAAFGYVAFGAVVIMHVSVYYLIYR